MKKISKNFVSTATAMAMAMAITAGSPVFAEEQFLRYNEQISTKAVFDEYVEKLGDIISEIELLEYYNNDNKHDEKISELEAEKDKLLQQSDMYGATTLNDKETCDIIVSADYSLSNKGRSLTPSELDNLINQLNSFYTVVSNKYQYSSNREVCTVVVMHRTDSALSKEKLTNTSGKVFYDRVMKGSDEARRWVNEIVQAYISKGLSTVLEMVPGVKFLPYDLFFDSKPDPNTLSITGDALIGNLTTHTTLSFTYVRDTTESSWVYCCSANQVLSDFSVLSIEHGVASIDKKFIHLPQKKFDGGYSNAVSNAVTIYNAKKANGNVSSGNFCINQVSYQTVYKGSITNKIITPLSPLELA